MKTEKEGIAEVKGVISLAEARKRKKE